MQFVDNIVKMSKSKIKIRQAYTLVELLLTMSIVAILVSLLQPSLAKMLAHSNSNGCKDQMRGMSTVIAIYTEDNDGFLPGPSYAGQHPRVRSAKGYHQKSIAGYVSTYLETKIDALGNEYSPGFICPSNRDLDLLLTPESRTQFRANTRMKIYGKEYKPFGYFYEDKPNIASKNILSIVDPSDKWAITDVDRENLAYLPKGYAPDLPLHIDVSRNYLYFDGRTDNKPWFPKP